MNNIFILFPHQLFKTIEPLKKMNMVYLVEEHLFFNQYKFHQQKLVLHRASMKYYQSYLQEHGIAVKYIEAHQQENDVRVLLGNLADTPDITLHHYPLFDNWLEQRFKNRCTALSINTEELNSSYFLNSTLDFNDYFSNKSKFFQTDFYIKQRKKLGILMQADGKPQGDKWSFDADNRLKYPKGKKPPEVTFPDINKYYHEAIAYVKQYYAANYGLISPTFIYPTTHQESEAWLQQFLQKRFVDFGSYEDALVSDEHILHHSVLTPMLNMGLLTPKQIIDETLAFAETHAIPLNSLEGFIRQIIGWREFIYGVYHSKGTQERTTNFWQFYKPIPASFYQGNTGITPVDEVIKKVLKTGYCHHIERLMILGNFMLLCEFNPDEVYKWFMEMFVDAYDWVMVPNVYGMSQFADGGLMATKPYISGSSYVLKMSHYKKDRWCEVWDALFWNFMNRHRDFFLSNPRIGMLIKTYDKMSDEKKKAMTTLCANLPF